MYFRNLFVCNINRFECHYLGTYFIVVCLFVVVVCLFVWLFGWLVVCLFFVCLYGWLVGFGVAVCFLSFWVCVLGFHASLFRYIRFYASLYKYIGFCMSVFRSIRIQLCMRHSAT